MKARSKVEYTNCHENISTIQFNHSIVSNYTTKNETDVQRYGSCHHTRSTLQRGPWCSLTCLNGLALFLIGSDGNRHA
jgi:hypothetical protein